MIKDNKGFTLVEVLVVSVILVILATMLIPTMVSYLTKSSDEKNYEDAKSILQVAQSEFYSLYAGNSHNDDYSSAITDSTKCNTYCSMDSDISQTTIAREIMKKAGFSIDFDFPCSVALVVGRYDTYGNPAPDKALYDPLLAYNVYAIIFQNYFEKEYFVMDKEGNVNYPTSIAALKNTINKYYDNGDIVEVQIYYVKLGMGNNNPPSAIWGSKAFDSGTVKNLNAKKKPTVYKG